MSYGEYLRTLDPTDPRQLAIMHSAGMLFRGAGYTHFDGTVPEAAIQAAIGAAYAHTTAPLRRLVDRFVLVICEALSNGTDVPGWAREALPSLPEIMAASDQLAARMERLALDTVEAALLVNHIGQEFDAVVISGSKPQRNGQRKRQRQRQRENGNGPSGIIQIAEPAVTARCAGELEVRHQGPGPASVRRTSPPGKSSLSWSTDAPAVRRPASDPRRSRGSRAAAARLKR